MSSDNVNVTFFDVTPENSGFLLIMLTNLKTSQGRIVIIFRLLEKNTYYNRSAVLIILRLKNTGVFLPTHIAA